MNDFIKLSSPATRQFWEIEVLFEDEHLLALNKPSHLLTSSDRCDAQRPNLITLLHHAIEHEAPWAKARSLGYLMNAHRLDADISGVLLLTKNKPALIALANLFGSEKPVKIYVALVHGAPRKNAFTVNARLASHPVEIGLMRVDEKQGKHSRTDFAVRERFSGYTLLQCRPVTARPHQIRVHLRHAGWPIVGDATYGGNPLLLSSLKPAYRLKPNQTERPLLASAALHAEELSFRHPVTNANVKIAAPWPKDLLVAVKYLRRYASQSGAGTAEISKTS